MFSLVSLVASSGWLGYCWLDGRTTSPLIFSSVVGWLMMLHPNIDVNYHDADDGQNLVEKSRVATPVWHSWDAICGGAPGKHRPPGPRNFLFDNSVISKGVEGYSRRGPVSKTGKIYQVMTEFGQPTVSVMENEPPPKGNTMYAITRGLQN